MVQKRMRAIAENLKVYGDHEMREPFLQCCKDGCKNAHIMEVQVEDAEEDILTSGYFCKSHFVEFLSGALPPLFEDYRVELAGMFGQNTIYVELDHWEFGALEELFASVKAIPITPQPEMLEAALAGAEPPAEFEAENVHDAA